jgi:ABC-type glycerol-3-phosphate transport system permease component
VIPEEQMRGRGRGGVGRTLLLWALAAIAILPFVEVVWLGRKPRQSVDRAFGVLSRRLPEHEARRKIEVDPRPLRAAAINSGIVGAVCSVACVVFCSMAGYAFAKKRFQGRALLFDLVLAWMALPPVLLMMPVFRISVFAGLYDTLLAVILPSCVSGFGIFYMRYAISSVPDSLIDAGRVDGLSELGVVFRLVIPSIWRSVVTLGALHFLTVWGAFTLPHAVVSSHDTYTVAVLLGRLVHDFQGLMWNDIMIVVGAALMPVFVVYVLFNRWLTRGITAIGDRRMRGEQNVRSTA